MDYKAYQDDLNSELNQFVNLLKVTLPRYSELVKKNNMTKVELAELGELEYLLLDINSKLREIKKQLDHDLFGQSLDVYYKLKRKALEGDIEAAKKIIVMRRAFDKALKENNLIIWN